MVALRAAMQNDGTAEQLAEQWAQEKLGTAEELVTRIRRQLAVDLEKHSFDKDRGYVPVWTYALPNT